MNEKELVSLGRRQLLKGGAAMAVAGLGSTLALSANAACVSQDEAKFDEVVDVIVVGSGFAGMSAALQARENGASVMVIDKMPVFAVLYDPVQGRVQLGNIVGQQPRCQGGTQHLHELCLLIDQDASFRFDVMGQPDKMHNDHEYQHQDQIR